MDFETIVQVLVAVQALARLAVAGRQWWQSCKPVTVADRSKALTRRVRPRPVKGVQR